MSAEGESGLTVDVAGAELVTHQLNKMHAAMLKSAEIKTMAWWWTEQLESGKRHGRGRDTAIILLPFGVHAQHLRDVRLLLKLELEPKNY